MELSFPATHSDLDHTRFSADTHNHYVMHYLHPSKNGILGLLLGLALGVFLASFLPATRLRTRSHAFTQGENATKRLQTTHIRPRIDLAQFYVFSCCHEKIDVHLRVLANLSGVHFVRQRECGIDGSARTGLSPFHHNR
jgi:hypothetical protein